MPSHEPHTPPPPGARDPDDPSEPGARENVPLLVGMWAAAALTYVAQPVVALLWAGAAMAAAIVVLVRGRCGPASPITALVLAGVGLLWMLVQLGALY